MQDKLKIDGKIIKAKPTSPLAQQQSLDEIQDVLKWLQISQSVGEQAFALGVKVEDVPEWIGEKFGIDPALIRNKAERSTIQQQVGQEMGQQQAMAQAEAQPEPQPTI